ncbi:hypothetical protein [Pseudorhodoferax soli]|uniref:Uncharacterized protein n=1 Tax=Pseudorhodoferax soli TaxID=545864 RepID=A0A368XHZ5_9BURK|nr:hypothetical protein [Pseudorhodoferax soli]RCW66107.1 hypothetical protein DES41_11165 [Pseudorhodoferax soli]
MSIRKAYPAQPPSASAGAGPQPTRRKLFLVALPFVLAGCATKPPVARDPEGSFCYRSKLEHYIKGPCVTEGVPSLQEDALAKALQPHPTLLTVYVVRQNIADGQDVVNVTADGTASIRTLPDTMARLRFKPGAHTLAFQFEDQQGVAQIEGHAGEVKFVRLRGAGFAWAVQYEWLNSTEQATRDSLQRTRLVADVLVP